MMLAGSPAFGTSSANRRNLPAAGPSPSHMTHISGGPPISPQRGPHNPIPRASPSVAGAHPQYAQKQQQPVVLATERVTTPNTTTATGRNEEVAIVGFRNKPTPEAYLKEVLGYSPEGSGSVILIPYSTDRVPMYHKWMQDPENLELTCSEPLSLADEYAMHAEWLADPGKLTYIICVVGQPLIEKGQHLWSQNQHFVQSNVSGTKVLRNLKFADEKLLLEGNNDDNGGNDNSCPPDSCQRDHHKERGDYHKECNSRPSYAGKIGENRVTPGSSPGGQIVFPPGFSHCAQPDSQDFDLGSAAPVALRLIELISGGVDAPEQSGQPGKNGGPGAPVGGPMGGPVGGHGCPVKSVSQKPEELQLSQLISTNVPDNKSYYNNNSATAGPPNAGHTPNYAGASPKSVISLDCLLKEPPRFSISDRQSSGVYSSSASPHLGGRSHQHGNNHNPRYSPIGSPMGPKPVGPDRRASPTGAPSSLAVAGRAHSMGAAQSSPPQRICLADLVPESSVSRSSLNSVGGLGHPTGPNGGSRGPARVNSTTPRTPPGFEPLEHNSCSSETLNKAHDSLGPSQRSSREQLANDKTSSTVHAALAPALQDGRTEVLHFHPWGQPQGNNKSRYSDGGSSSGRTSGSGPNESTLPGLNGDSSTTHPYAIYPVGDINLHSDELDEEDGTAEVDVMVAVREARRRGVAQEALSILMRYAKAELGVKKFRAKIMTKNDSSLRLFEKKMGFVHEKNVECFNEVWLVKRT